jgi:phosphotriesterase-related protein
MATVNTANGRLALEDLGKTLIHEHVLVGFPGWYLNSRRPKFQRAEVMARVVDAFQQLHAYGVRSVVDPCPMDLGRDVEFCAEVAQRSGVNLICTTGVYDEAMGISYTFKYLEVDEIAEIYIKEIEDGIAQTGIRAGAIKIATGDGQVTDYERKAVTAAARAAKATGVPIISHTENCSCGQDQIDIVTGEGAPARCLLVGHSDGRDDPAYQEAIAARGAYVGFDRFGLEMIVPDEIRMKNLKNLVDRGYRDRIMVSHDTVHCFLGDNVPGLGDAAALAKIAPHWRLTHLFENILPRLKQLGLSQGDFDHIVTENPRRFFSEASSI